MATISQVYILEDVPIERDSEDTLSWANVSEQEAYFTSLSMLPRMVEATYQRENDMIRFPAPYDYLQDCSYCMYRNTPNDPWTYAFITDMKYAGPEVTHVFIETDYIQTDYFKVQYNYDFIEYMHVPISEDVAGNHLVPEGMETGDYVANGENVSFNAVNANDMVHVIAAPLTVYFDSAHENIDVHKSYVGTRYGGYSTPNQYYWFANNGEGSVERNFWFEVVENANLSDTICATFLWPRKLVKADSSGTPISGTWGRINSDSGLVDVINIPIPTTIDGYSPKNKKLLAFPYNFLYGTNNQGQTNYFSYERFKTPTPGQVSFSATGACHEASKITCYPTWGYKGSGYDAVNYDDFLTLPSPIQTAYIVDNYVAWLAQNGASWTISNTLKIGGGIVGTVASLATGNAVGALTSGSSTILNAIQAGTNIYEHYISPPSVAGNAGSGATQLDFNIGGYGFNFIPFSITSEYGKKLDNRMELYGYKLLELRKIVIRNRPEWSYFKVNGSTISGRISSKSLNAWRSKFERGIRFWHKPANFGNYSLNNH